MRFLQGFFEPTIDQILEKPEPSDEDILKLLYEYERKLKESFDVKSGKIIQNSSDNRKKLYEFFKKQKSELIAKAKTTAGFTAAHIAAEFLDSDFLMSLVKNNLQIINAKFNLSSKKARAREITPLAMALMQDFVSNEAAIKLIEQGANIDCIIPFDSKFIAPNGNTPQKSSFEIACEHKDVALARAIMKQDTFANLLYVGHLNLIKMSMLANDQLLFKEVLNLYQNNEKDGEQNGEHSEGRKHFQGNLRIDLVNELLNYIMDNKDDEFFRQILYEHIVTFAGHAHYYQGQQKERQTFLQTVLSCIKQNLIKDEDGLFIALSFGVQEQTVSEEFCKIFIEKGAFDQVLLLSYSQEQLPEAVANLSIEELYEKNALELLLFKLSKTNNINQEELQKLFNNAIQYSQYDFAKKLLEQHPNQINISAYKNQESVINKLIAAPPSKKHHDFLNYILNIEQNLIFLIDKASLVHGYIHADVESQQTYRFIFEKIINQNDNLRINVSENDGKVSSKTFLNIAIDKGDYETVNLFIQKGFDVNDGIKIDNELILSPLNQAISLLYLEMNQNPPNNESISSYKNIIHQLLSCEQIKIDNDFTLGEGDKFPAIAFLIANNILTVNQFEAIKAQIKIDYRDQNDNNLLSSALSAGNIELAKKIIGTDPQLLTQLNKQRQNPIMYAHEAIKSLSKEQKEDFFNSIKAHILQEKDLDGRTTLDYFIAAGDIESAEILINNGYQITQETIFAAYSNSDQKVRETTVSYLISKESAGQYLQNRYTAENAIGQNFLGFICSIKSGQEAIDIIKESLQNGSNINKPDKNNVTPLAFAVTNGDPEVVRFLLGNSGININAQDKNGNSPLMVACYQYNKTNNPKDKEIILSLINDPRIDLNIRNKEGINAFTLITKPNKLDHFKGDQELIAQFIQLGANPLYDIKKAAPLWLRVARTGFAMSLCHYLSKLLCHYVPGVSVWVRSTETVINAYVLSSEISSYVRSKVSNFLDSNKLDLTGVSMLGSYHITAFGNVVYGEKLKMKIGGNHHYENAQDAIFTLQDLEKKLSELSQNNDNDPEKANQANHAKQIILYSLFKQYSQVQKELSKPSLGLIFDKKIRKQLQGHIKLLDNAYKTTMTNVLKAIPEEPAPALKSLLKSEKSKDIADTLVANKESEDSKKFLEILEKIQNGQILVPLDQRYKVAEILYHYNNFNDQSRDEILIPKQEIVARINAVNQIDFSGLSVAVTQEMKSESRFQRRDNTKFSAVVSGVIEQTADMLGSNPDAVKEGVVSLSGEMARMGVNAVYMVRQNPLIGTAAINMSGIAVSAVASAINIATSPITIGLALLLGGAYYMYNRSSNMSQNKNTTLPINKTEARPDLDAQQNLQEKFEQFQLSYPQLASSNINIQRTGNALAITRS